jgi:hypothetical protein
VFGRAERQEPQIANAVMEAAPLAVFTVTIA